MVGTEPLESGEVLAGGYRIVRVLASGGMGTVYVAEQIATGRQRALKRMHATLIGEPQVHQLFEREVRVGDRIDSDHVVEVLDAGVDEGTGLPWLAMELLQGRSLREEVDEMGPTPWPRATPILLQICHGLAAAHRVGVMHRDLKPENVMVCPPDREGASLLVKILDFGLARFVDSATSITPPMGTPLWMAPEQVIGQPLGLTVDVFALGLVAFYVLAGKPFWRASEKGVMPVIHELLYTPVPKATQRAADLGAPATALPPGFDEWFSRCTARAPGDRFADAGEARDALRAVLGVEPDRPAAITSPAPPAPQPPGAAYDPAWFVGRDAEAEEAARYLRVAGKPAVLWGPRHSGKTWLLRRLIAEMRSQDACRTAIVQAHLLPARASLEALLHAFGEALLEACGADPGALPDQRRGHGTPMQRLTRMVQREILAADETPLLLAIDGVDLLWRSRVRDDFFALLRAWAERTEPEWSRLRLLLAVSTAPAALIDDTHRSPFNLTVPVRLRGLDPQALSRLARLHGLVYSEADLLSLGAACAGQPMMARRILYRAATASLDVAGATAAEVDELSTWLREQGLLAAARAVLEGGGQELKPEERSRLVRAGVVIEGPGGELDLTTPCHRRAAGDRP
ncbi:MAG: serine/threonine-protein kinase [Polyangiaceae bacterium]